MEKQESAPSKYLKELMLGGMDGIVTTFAVVAGFSGAKSSGVDLIGTTAVLIFGFANLFADATSMGLGNFLSIRSDNKVHHTKENANLKSLFTFISFVVFGFIPLTPYVFVSDYVTFNLFYISIAFTAMALFLLALVRSFATKEKFFRVLLEVMIIGCSASFVAYLVGNSFSQ